MRLWPAFFIGDLFEEEDIYTSTSSYFQFDTNDNSLKEVAQMKIARHCVSSADFKRIVITS